MIDDDEEQTKKQDPALQPRNLEPLSLEDLENFIAFLNLEIERAHAEIDRKKSAGSAAAAFFKS